MMITVDAQIIRSAQHCVGVNKAREALNGILLAANGDVAASDGSIIFQKPHAFEPEDGYENTVLVLSKKLPEEAAKVGFDLTGRTAFITVGDEILQEEISIIDAKFPKYAQAVESAVSRAQHDKMPDTVTLDTPYLAKLADIFPDSILTLRHGDCRDATVVRPTGARRGVDTSHRCLDDALVILATCDVPEAWKAATYYTATK